MVLPVVERELRVAARRRSTYRARMFAVVGMLAAFVFAELTFITQYQNAAQHGRLLFQIFAWLAFIFAALSGLVGTADCMTMEKREGTLGLLFLTDLTGYDVIFGKLAANSMAVLYGVIASVPILSVPIIMGGVGLFQFIKVALLLLTVLALSCSVGIVISTYSRNERKAMVFAILLMAAILFVPMFTAALLQDRQMIKEQGMVNILNLSPAFSMGLVLFESRMGFGSGYAAFVKYHVWVTLGWTWLLIIVFLVSAARKARLSWQDVEQSTTLTRSRPLPLRKWQPPKWILDLNPYQWLALRGETTPRAVWGFVLALFAIWIIATMKYGRFMFEREVLMPTVIIVNLFLKVWVVGEASRRFIDDRQNNAMELILSTPINEKDVARGQWRALISLFGIPILAVTIWEFFMLQSMRELFQGQNWTRIETALFVPIDAAALAWLGMWYALKLKGRIRVMLTCLGLILVIPTMADAVSQRLIEFWFVRKSYAWINNSQHTRGIIVLVATLVFDLAMISWAQRNVMRNLRRLAVERFTKP